MAVRQAPQDVVKRDEAVNKDWIWAAVIVAAPLLVFGALEAIGFLRRRRRAAIGRRSKRPGRI